MSGSQVKEAVVPTIMLVMVGVVSGVFMVVRVLVAIECSWPLLDVVSVTVGCFVVELWRGWE